MRPEATPLFLILCLMLLWCEACRCDEETPPAQDPALTGTPPAPPVQEIEKAGPTAIEFQSVGGARIAAEILPGKNDSSLAIIFVPSRDTSRAEWTPLVTAFQKSQNFSLIHYDSRGTGKSEHGAAESDDWSETDFLLADVRGILNIVKSREEISPTAFILIGSSVGSSAALRIALEEPMVKAIVSLSPGLSYLDLDIRDTVKALQDRQLISFASRGDKYAAHSARTFTQLHPGATSIILETGKTHGAAILHQHPEVVEQIKDWVEKQFPETTRQKPLSL